MCSRRALCSPKASAILARQRTSEANGAMKIVSFHDVHRDRVRCSDQPLYRSMIFLREAYWVTTTDREPSIWKNTLRRGKSGQWENRDVCRQFWRSQISQKISSVPIIDRWIPTFVPTNFLNLKIGWMSISKTIFSKTRKDQKIVENFANFVYLNTTCKVLL